MRNSVASFTVPVVSFLLLILFVICLTAIQHFEEHKYLSLELWKTVGVLSIVMSFASAFASAMFWKTGNRDSKAFSLIFVAMIFGIFVPDILYPKFEVSNPDIALYVTLIKEIATFACAGAAGGLFAMSAESYMQNKRDDLAATGCNFESSRKELVKLSDKVNALKVSLFVVVSLQITTVLLVIYCI
jgi:hypothetical protein